MIEHSPRKKGSAHKAGKARIVGLNSNSDTCWSQIWSWIEECGRDHFLCGSQNTFMAMPITSSRTLPKRVLDIGNGDTLEPTVQLSESNFSEGVYIALSHAWGARLPIKTTKTNLEQFKKGIPWNDFSETFQDAIHITRKLGVRYLWINALYIIQDDKSDWEREAANMAVIYRDAILVISATLSMDSSGGCFSDRRTSIKAGVLQNNDGTTTKVFARTRLPHEAFSQEQAFSTRWDRNEKLKTNSLRKRERDLAEHPVLQRAWYYQKRLLSRRTLHYTRHELVWEYVHATHCECGMLYYASDDTKSIRRQLNRVRFDESDPRMDLFRRDRQQPWWLPEFWGKIIQPYSHKRLGYATDTLPALAGLASTLASGDGVYLGKYLAGLWERDIGTFLRWVPLSKDAVRPRDKTQCSFPSWSWTSIDTPFHWPSVGGKETTKLCYAVTGNNFKPTFEDENPVINVYRTATGYSVSMPKINYSKWTGGSLFVKAKAFEATLTGIDDSQDVHAAFLERDGIQCSFVVDRRPQCLGLVGHSVHVMRLTTVSVPENVEESRRGWALPRSLAFVLLKVPGKEDTFERIGMLQGVPEEWSQYEGDEFHDFELV
jgi:hypothetical protein